MRQEETYLGLLKHGCMNACLHGTIMESESEANSCPHANSMHSCYPTFMYSHCQALTNLQ